MKSSIFYTFAFLTFIILQNTGCVSIGISKSQSRKSEVVELKEPAPPFEEIEVVHLDRSWSNSRNGNTISYISECELQNDQPLKRVFQGIISSIDNPIIIEESNVNYNSREAFHTIVEGRVDGVLTRFQLLIFKKNNCTYTLTYTAVFKSFAENQKQFQNFVKGFKVP